MGEGEPGAGTEPVSSGELGPGPRGGRRVHPGPDRGSIRSMTEPSITVNDLKSWEAHGAVWRALEVSDERAVIQLCSCMGEPVDVVGSAEAELIAFVREHPASEF